MENVEKATYIKTDMGEIGKVKKIDFDTVYFDKGVTFISNIIEESDNLLELLEIGCTILTDKQYRLKCFKGE